MGEKGKGKEKEKKEEKKRDPPNQTKQDKTEKRLIAPGVRVGKIHVWPNNIWAVSSVNFKLELGVGLIACFRLGVVDCVGGVIWMLILVSGVS